MDNVQRLALVLIGATVISACHDTPTALDEPDPAVIAKTEPLTQATYDDGQNVVSENFKPRLKLEVSVVGDLVPHATVTVEIVGRASKKLTNGEVRVFLPTMAAMKHAALGERASYPVGKPFPTVAKWQLPEMEEADHWKRSFNIKLPDEGGYYHLAVDADTRGPNDKAHLHSIDDAHDQAWLYVTESGGSVTPSFDESVFDDHIIPQPGPFEVKHSHSPGDQTAHDVAEANFDGSGDPITVRLVYFDDGAYEIAEGAVVIATYISQSDKRGYNVERTVPASGIVRFDCPAEYEYIEGSSMVPDTEEVNARYHLAYWQADESDCGGSIQVRGNERAFVPWRNLNELIPRIESYFNKYRSPVNYRVGFRFYHRTSYSISSDMITIHEDDYNDFWLTGHEFGHALHNLALGGMWSTGANCWNHEVSKPSSYRCAFQEGFADYAGSVGEEDEAYWESGRYDSDDGAPGEIEGNIAILLHDLIDDRNESGDETSYSADYVTDVFQTCRVGSRRDDVSDFVWCLENRVNRSVHSDNFPGIGVPSRATESATEPSDWDADDIRSTWLLSVGK